MQFPTKTGLYYGEGWHTPKAGKRAASINPANGELLIEVAEGSAEDAEEVVAAARSGFEIWRHTPPFERADALRKIATIIRDNADELAFLESSDCGNPIRNVKIDMMIAASGIDFFAGLITELKGDTIPVSSQALNFTRREPRGVILRIVAFNHPLMFAALKAAAPLVTGNAVIIKPAEQAPLSGLRFAELIDGILPPGVLNIVNGDRHLAAALVSHSGVDMVGLVGSVGTGRAVLRGAAEGLKPTILELGGKNALIACADADPDRVARAVITGMNFNWCGQSCGSTSRAFIHEAIYDAVVSRLQDMAGEFIPGEPTDPSTTMGALIARQHYERVIDYIESGKAQGARLLCGGPVEDVPELSRGLFIRPTIFVDADMSMRIAREEIFGPVLCVFKWHDECTMIEQVNELEYGLTCSIWTNDISTAHRLAAEAQAGQVWINDVAKHVTGAPFGGFKHSGLGREGGIEELYACTEEKNVYINLS